MMPIGLHMKKNQISPLALSQTSAYCKNIPFLSVTLLLSFFTIYHFAPYKNALHKKIKQPIGSNHPSQLTKQKNKEKPRNQ
jgi:hypothetical protein